MCLNPKNKILKTSFYIIKDISFSFRKLRNSEQGACNCNKLLQE